MTLASQVERLACRCLEYEGIADEMLATIKLNVERGYITAINDKGKLNLQKIIATWERHIAIADETYQKGTMMIIPTVGRVVWYYPPNYLPGDKQPQPLAAIVTCVHSNTCVNLAIFNTDGSPYDCPPTSIPLLPEDTARPDGGHFCEWMPYQIGQAKKHEGVK